MIRMRALTSFTWGNANEVKHPDDEVMATTEEACTLRALGWAEDADIPAVPRPRGRPRTRNLEPSHTGGYLTK